MNKIKLAEKLEHCTYMVYVFDKNVTVEIGSAVSVNKNGTLITAAHVIIGSDFDYDVLKSPDLKVMAKTKKGKFKEYSVGITAPKIQNQYLTTPIIIDLCILKPVNEMTDIPFFSICDYRNVDGTDVLLAGHPDEVRLPFNFDEKLDLQNKEIHQQLPNIDISKNLLMIKHGIVGNSSGFSFSDDSNTNKLEGEIYYIDNVMHSGSSGGPVVNSKSELIGIISERASTSISTEKFIGLVTPSGSSLAISPRTMNQFIS